ncbi:hypothetical protein M431DRAFT_287232 [Trichoderma harzianum CBS 226.95]|uniref:Uncharacterized protein n=1 Tax=Trichoderma harzianum CBS 226.95 TaxID=983964 RepID=A0A2T4AP07_TRIHA|nr:hypothetical protein M431DRAFT_287232 [Trichoderma harzianum CBS 226.95]PTB58815.1 hypothetical protein M431DRAFT_287232 [Trichoderma harzianum CBS 226.95]
MRAGAKQDWFVASHRGHKSPRDGRMKNGSCISAHTAGFLLYLQVCLSSCLLTMPNMATQERDYRRICGVTDGLQYRCDIHIMDTDTRFCFQCQL